MKVSSPRLPGFERGVQMQLGDSQQAGSGTTGAQSASPEGLAMSRNRQPSGSPTGDAPAATPPDLCEMWLPALGFKRCPKPATVLLDGGNYGPYRYCNDCATDMQRTDPNWKRVGE